MNISTIDIAVLIAAFLSTIVTFVGWRKTYSYQLELFNRQVHAETQKENRSIARTIEAEDRAVIKNLLMVSNDLLATKDIRDSSLLQGTPSLEEQVSIEKMAQLRALLADASNIVNRRGGKGEQDLGNLVHRLCLASTILCVAATGSEQYKWGKEITEAEQELAEVQKQFLLMWPEEMSSTNPSDA